MEKINKRKIVLLIVVSWLNVVMAQPTIIPYTPDPTNDFTPTLQWYPVSGATQYKIQIATDVAFTSPIEQIVSSVTSYTHGSNLPEDTIYWHVSSDTSNPAFSDYSMTDDFIITGAPILIPYTPDPTPDKTPTFYWNSVSGASNYKFQLADNISFATPIVDVNISGSTSYMVSGPVLSPQTYYWRVSSDLDYNKYFGYDAFEFQIPSVIPYPEDTTIDQTPTLTWNEYPGAISYRIEIDEDIAFGSPLVDFVSNSTSYTPMTNLSQGTNYWRISTNYDYTSFSETDSVVININQYPQPIPFSPETVSTLQPLFQWNPVSGASSYNLWVDDESNFNSPRVIEQANIGGTSYNEPSPMAQGTYYWKVSSSLKPNSWCPYEIVTINTAPNIYEYLPDPTPVANPTFTWNPVSGATGYKIEIADNISFATPITAYISGSTFYTASLPNEGIWYWHVSSDIDTNYFSNTDDFVYQKPQLNRWEGIAIHDVYPTFTWNSYPNVTTYKIEVDQDIGFATTGWYSYVSNSTSYNSPWYLSAGTTWYWRVSTDIDYNAYSNIDSVRVTGSPELVHFTFDTTTDLRVTFKWHTVSGAGYYRIQADDTVDFSNTIFDISTNSYTDTTYNHYNYYSEDLPLGKLYWRVSSSNNSNDFSDPDSVVFIDTMSCWHVSTNGDSANTGTAVSPIDSLRRALDLAGPGDTIKVAAGTYNMNGYIFIQDSFIVILGGYSNDFSVRNSDSLVTLFDAMNMYSIETQTAAKYCHIDGITFKNQLSGCILRFGYSPYGSVTNCKFVRCYKGVEVHQAQYIKIVNNIFAYDSIGVFVDYSGYGVDIINNTFSQNSYGVMEGEMVDSIQVINNIFAFNKNGVYDSMGTTDTIRNNAFYGNEIMYRNYSGTAFTDITYLDTNVCHSDNIAQNPMFKDTSYASYDFHLMLASPCIDSGDPGMPYANEPSPNGGRINLGAYGNTPWATISGTAPSITVQPLSDTCEVGGTHAFSVTAAGTTPFTYQWYKDAVAINNATSPSYSISPVGLSDSGTYSVQVWNLYGTVVSDTVELFVPVPLTISTQPMSQTVLESTAVQLSAAGAGHSPISYKWIKNFSNTVGTVSLFSIQYMTVSDTGTYYCEIYNEFDTLYSDTVNLWIEKPPVADFTATPLTGIDTTLVAFSNLSTGDGDRWIWNYGDGSKLDTTVTQVDVMHQYTLPGVYTVSLKAENTTFNVDSTLTRMNYITIYQKSVSTFSGTPTTGIDSVTVQFTLDSISAGVSEWIWTYGDGAVDSFSTAINPTHHYAAPGSYDVKLKVSGAGGVDSTVRQSYITVYTRAKAIFTASDTIGEAPLSVTFTNSSTGDIASCLWRFGDGSSDTATSPTHIYQSRGTYNVTLVVSGNGGVDSVTKASYISVINSPPVLTLQAVDTAQEDSLWQMTASVSDANNDAVTLSFISGAPSDMAINQSAHTFIWTPDNNDIGEYTVSVLADDGYGGTDTASFSLTVLNTNDFPVIDSIIFPDTAWEDSLVSGKMFVTDPDPMDSVFLTIGPNVAWLTVSKKTITRGGWQFTFSGTPGDADTGLISVKFVVMDRESLMVDTVKTVYVANTNDPPETKLSKKSVYYGAVNYVISATDDSDTIFTFKAQLTGSGVRIDTVVTSTSGTFAFYPLVDGKYVFLCAATDQDGLADPTPYIDSLVISGASTHTWSDSGVWDMLSVPAASYSPVTIKTKGALLYWDESKQPDDLYKYYTREDGISQITGGNSYWFRPDSNCVVNLERRDLPLNDSMVIQLQKAEYGWNQIASPYPYPVKWNSTLTLWEWDAVQRDFVESDGILYPWEGYWVQTESAVPVTVNGNPLFAGKAFSRRSKTVFVDKNEWTFRIALKTNINRDADNLFGVSKSAENGYDPLDRPEPPRMGNEPYIFFAHPEWKRSVNRFASDIRHTWKDEENIFQIGISPCPKEVTSLIVTIAGYDAEMPIYLFINNPPDVKQYKPDMAVTLTPASTVQYRTVFATTDKDFLLKFPYKFAMNHPFPNPCRPRATIQYTLPYRWESNGWLNTEPYRVRMVIYDVRGRLVRELVNRKQGPGHYRIVWRGKSNTGHLVASGTYFVRLIAGKYSSVKKIIALR